MSKNRKEHRRQLKIKGIAARVKAKKQAQHDKNMLTLKKVMLHSADLKSKHPELFDAVMDMAGKLSEASGLNVPELIDDGARMHFGRDRFGKSFYAGSYARQMENMTTVTKKLFDERMLWIDESIIGDISALAQTLGETGEISELSWNALDEDLPICSAEFEGPVNATGEWLDKWFGFPPAVHKNDD